MSVYFEKDELLNIDETSKLKAGDSKKTDAENTIFTSHLIFDWSCLMEYGQ